MVRSLNCPIFETTPKSFGDLNNIGKGTFDPKPGRLLYGVSPLHSFPRVLFALGVYTGTPNLADERSSLEGSHDGTESQDSSGVV